MNYFFLNFSIGNLTFPTNSSLLPDLMEEDDIDDSSYTSIQVKEYTLKEDKDDSSYTSIQVKEYTL